MLLKQVRALYAQERQSLLNLARCASVAGAVTVAGPVLADSDRPDLENGTGDDPTKPFGKIELLDRYTAAPGLGVAEGTTKVSKPTRRSLGSTRRSGSLRNGS